MNLTIKKLALASTIALATTTWADTATSANVMAPLIIDNWSDFQNDLNDAKSIGVTGVSVDVWWGKVEAGGDQQFDWSYYDQVFQTIENAGLDIVPIMSFHQCGGNVGDDCNVPLPSWIWNHYSNEGVYASDLKYRSEYDNESVETISLWRDEYVLSEYREFMEAFETHFAAKADNISEINISMGPAGELRYPSYNSHDKKLTDFPTRGGLQAYSAPAIQDFQDWAVDKYGGINGINTAWGFGLSSVDQVGPPSNVDSFINNGDQFNTQYGKDFFSWYHESLIQHGVRMMDNALVSLDGAFSDIELGFKIPGVHWKMSAPDNTRRSAEMAAGLIPSDSIDSPNGHGYESIISVASRYNNESRGVVLHFTCLEMNDSFSDGYSMAKTLVGWVADEAERQGVAIKGENALWGGVTWSGGWDNIRSAFTNHSYSGLTVLRLEQVSGGSAGQNQYESFISDYLVTEGDWERTVIFIYGQTVEGQDMFVRGGIDHGYANTNLGRNCQTWNFECAIPIRHNNLRNDTTTPWKSGDLYLDWYGAESGQSAASVGSPLDWTTSDSSNPNKVAVQGFGYETLNDYGDHYWMLDVEMDCSKTVNGWFELKSYISNGPEWEGDVAQSGTPYSSGNHFAECGKLNVFQRGSSSAIIGDL